MNAPAIGLQTILILSFRFMSSLGSNVSADSRQDRMTKLIKRSVSEKSITSGAAKNYFH